MKKKLSEMDFGDYGTVCEISSNKSGLRALGVREGKTLTMKAACKRAGCCNAR